MKCIYCKQDITNDNKSDEHVFPESFGCPNSWTMDCVCRKCNIDFGGTIERYLASDSIEGLWRLQQIGSSSKKPIRQTRIKINIPNEERYGEFRGAIVYFDFSKKDSLLLPSQILIKDEEGNRNFFLVEDIEKDEIKNELYKHKGRGFWIFAHNADNEKTAIEKLKQIGIEFNPIKEEKLPILALEDDGKFKVIVEGIMDNMIFRSIAKIAFNYLAKVKGHDYVLDSKFDVIREYIKSGTKPNFKIVKIKGGHILADETNDKYFFEGHIFTIQTKGNHIIGKVSLSNTFTFYYVVDLGILGTIWYELKSGHAYSLKEDKIINLFSPSLIAMPKPNPKLIFLKK